MSTETRERPGMLRGTAGPPGGDASGGRAAAAPVALPRAWDLRPGDHYRGRTVADVRGEVGLASHPVAVVSFTSPDPAHVRRARIGAAHADTDRGHDTVRVLARDWVRDRGLREGEPVDLAQLRTAVMAAARSRPALR